MSQKIDFKAVWPPNGHADSVGDKLRNGSTESNAVPWAIYLNKLIALEFLNKDFFIVLLDILIFTGFGG